jgi:hypothetical protein
LVVVAGVPGPKESLENLTLVVVVVVAKGQEQISLVEMEALAS